MVTPLERALEILPKYYQCPNAKKILEWYFGHDWKTLNETSLEILKLTKDGDDAVAWELHELVEACEVYRIAPNLKSPVLGVPLQKRFLEEVKPIAHKKATEVEIKYLRDRKRWDLIREVRRREIRATFKRWGIFR